MSTVSLAGVQLLKKYYKIWIDFEVVVKSNNVNYIL